MANQALLIGVAVGVFFAGLGVGYAIFQASQPNFANMSPQQMQQMMSNPQMMAQWHQTMMNNPQAFNNWMGMMNNPQYMNQMMGAMMGNPQMSQYMMNTMMGNPQFMHTMMGNPQFQQNWIGPWMSNSTNWKGMMDSGWMNQGMMGNNMMGGNMMGNWKAGQPTTKNNEVLSTINNIEKLLDQVSSKYGSGDKNDALSLATSAYLENYEYVESAIAAKDLKQMEKIELFLRVDLRSMIQNGKSVDDVNAKIDSIKAELEKVKKLFS
ncbi:MAG TPA: hypothetical protein VLF17_04990 [Candidatus Nitrosotenuis sp.]|nr:hypothetical protein [Candidatus Nitrosotenuis sp.]